MCASGITVLCRAFVRLLDITVSRGMGCFVSCFRSRDDRRNRVGPRSQGALGCQNQVSSLFLSREDSSCEETVDFSFGSALVDKELEDEAKFLKACGTIPETPPEIRKGSEKIKSCDIDSGHLNNHSSLSQTSVRKLQLDEYPDQPSSPVKLDKERGMDANSPYHSSSRISIGSNNSNSADSVKTAVQVHVNQDDNILIPVSPWTSDTNIKCRSKSVRFAFNDATSSGSSSENDGKDSKKLGTPIYQGVFKPSPNPTPLKLTDDMQTPGTVYLTALENSVHGKVRVRSHHVYSVPYPVDTPSQCLVLKDLDPNFQYLSAEPGESLAQLDSATPVSKEGFEVPSNQTQLIVDSPTFSSRKPPFGRTPGDRPIIGNVATHWNDYETFNEPAKWWDGNGIPNSTHKYKEDQKVSWHETPFEERLDKVFSNKIPILQRKLAVSTAILFEENESELSQSPSATHPEPAVSC